MKKWKQTGKKTLSVIMAIMMLMSAWVWVAPTEASAATAGNYYVEITWNVSDTKEYSNKFTGTETENGARAGMILYYKTNNGTGTEQKVYWDIGHEDNKGTAYGTYVDASTGAHTNSKTTHTTKCIISGFPTAFYATSDSDYFLDGGVYDVTKIVVGKPSTNSLSSATITNKTTLWEGTGHNDTTTEWKWWKITADGTGADGKLTVTETGNDSKNGYASSTNENWKFPTPTTTTTYTGKVDNVSIPKSGTSDVMTVKVIANDQYGVQMGTPTWSVSRDGSNGDNNGISVSPTSGDSTTVKLTNAANVSSTTDTQTGTITATWGNAGSLSDTFTITDSYYTATFNYQTQNDDNNTSSTKTETREGYHGDSITAPTVPQYYDQDYLKTFSAWTPTYSSTITKDVTYTATYTDKFVEADYSAVDKAIAAVNAEKDKWGAEYDAKFTYATRMAVDAAVNAVIRGKGRTEQATVDKYATDINAALSALEPNKYAVIFLDNNGAILLYEKNVEYKSSIENVPSLPEDQKVYYDSTNHYTYTGWDTEEYKSVIDDLVIQPVYVAEAHNFTKTEDVESTCTQKGAKRYICDCGYSYTVDESGYGDHVWSEFKTDIYPTCTTAGQKSKYCTECGIQGEIAVIDPLGHQWGTISSLAPSTCENSGINTRLCDACGICEHTLVAPLGHNYTKTTVAPTCTSKGYDEYTCANCGHSYRDYNVAMLDHSYTTDTVISDAHCDIPGVKLLTCDCGRSITDTIAAPGHTESGLKTVIEATCTGKGYQENTCTKCSALLGTETLDALGHNYVEKTVVAPTCTAKGYTIEECDRVNCGAQKITNETDALTHSWTSTTHAATCTSGAYVEHVCANDSTHNYLEYINGSAALTHEFTGTETIISAATCTADGSKTVQCSRCDATTTVIIPKLGHNYGEWDKTTNPATNDKDGTWTRKCANCGDVETLTIPKGGHVFEEDTAQYVAPKCNSKGQRVYKCTAHDNCIASVTVELDYAQHTVTQKVTEATCTKEGSVEAYCSVCGTSFSTMSTPKKAHNPVAGTPVAPTCTTSGYTPYACACGTFSYNLYDESKPAKGHSWGEYIVEKDATCTEDGKKVASCTNEGCTAKDEEVIPKTGHNYVENAEKATAATCTTLATKTFECDCGASYVKHEGELADHSFETLVKTVPATNDSLGYEERKCACGLTEITILEATGSHVFEEKITEECVAPTCTENGTDVYKCKTHTDCGVKSSVLVPRLGHTVTAVYKAPTCTEEGSSEAYCSACKSIINSTPVPVKGHAYNTSSVTTEPGCESKGERTFTCACGAKLTEELPAKGHTLTTIVTDAKCGEKGSVVNKCAVEGCDYTKTVAELAAKGHIWGTTPTDTVKATCETDGSETYKCVNCEATNVVVIPKLGHEWSAWTVVPSTNDAPGSVSRTCSRGCTESVEIPAGGHNLVEDKDAYKAPKCNEKGHITYKCTAHTNCSITVTVELYYAQHTVVYRETQATCTSGGTVEAYCKDCNVSFGVKTTLAKAHTYTAQTPVEATCTTSGYTPYKCSCGDTYNVYDVSKPAKGHNFDETITANVTITDATCTTDGKKIVKCSRCNVTNEITIPATGHSYSAEVVQEQTCVNVEKTKYTCACGDTYTVITKEAKGHTYGDWETVTPATADKNGVQKRICSCGDVEYGLLAPIGDHEFTVKVEKEATCTEAGEKSYTCSKHENCSANYTEKIPATGHTQKIVYEAPTCTEKGVSKVVCSVKTCNAEILKEEIDAKGHVYTSEVTTVPKCTTAGEKTFTCVNCTDSTYTETIPATGIHNLTTTVNDASCETEGSVVTTCSDCDYENTIPLAKKNHNWNDGKETTAPTCEGKGTMTYTCTLCNETKTEDIPAKGHSFGDWEVTPSTNGVAGSVSRKCACGKTESVEIPAGGHNLVATTTQDATCTSTGSITYTCEAHDGACGITVTVTTAMLQHKLVHSESQATCTENGTVITKCEKCDTVTYITTIPAKGHAYNSSEVTTDPGCESEGLRTYTCDCGDTKTETIPAKGHQYKTTVTEATCTTPGKVVTECTVCQDEKVKTETVLPAMGHDFTGTETLINSANCENDGEKTVKCSRCDATTTVILPKRGHEYGEWDKTTNPATNDKDGTWTRECANCNDVESITIPKGGHNLVEDKDAYKAPKCNEKGKQVFKCTAHENCSVTVTVELDYTQHTIVKENKSASCTENGYSKTYCSECNVEFNKVEIPATHHSYVGAETLGATCISEGVMTYTCSKCNDSYTESIPMIQHTYKAGEEVKATCTTRGYIPYSCTTQGCTSAYEVLTAEAKGHTYSELVESTATCTAGGKMTLKCADCDETMETTVPALGHDYQKISSTSADCTASATETYKCSRCEASYTVSVGDKAEHQFTAWKTIAEATEDALGYETRSCTKCGKVELKEIPAIGNHNFDSLKSETPSTCDTAGEKVYACSTHTDCGLTSTVVIPAKGHDMQKTAEAVAPTCTNTGKTAAYTCANACGKTEGGEEIAALGHTYGEGVVTPATCEAEGKIVYTCAVCKDTHISVIAIDEDAHQYETTVNDATCTDTGSVVVKCKLCKEETTIKTLPMLEHTWTVDTVTPATCEADGTTYYKCACDATKEVVIPKLGHNMTAGVSVEATCTENGYTPYTCQNVVDGVKCAYSYNVYTTSAKGHSYKQTANSATCTQAGVITLTCELCNNKITTASTALGHDWSAWTTVAPTAEKDGSMTRSCNRDGCKEEEVITLPNLGHDMQKDEAKSTPATCTSEGADVYVCTTHENCSITYTIPVAKKAHTFDYANGTEVKATCTTDGTITYTCTADGCDETEIERIPATGHNLSTKVTPATCQVEGSVVTSCSNSNCDYKLETKLGYAAHKLIVVSESEPTCEADGIVKVKCSENGCTHVASTITIPAKGHDYSGEESNVVPATCEKDGSKDVKCKNCTDTKNVVIPATGHNYVAGESVSATCTESAYTVFTCDCGASYSRLDSQPNGHSWKEGTVKTPATCEGEGVTLVECNNCDATYEKKLPAIGHSWGSWTTTKYPTATEDGEMTRSCIRGCNKTETAVIPALGGGDVTYTVTFMVNGEVVATQNVNYGAAATAPVVSKAPDASGHYSYVWDVDFTNVTDNLTVTAIFTPELHTFGDWITVRESTCQSNGYQTRKCSACNYEESKAIVLADHNYSVILDEKAPTCTEKGYKDAVCSVCGKVEKLTIKRLGHVMTYHERVYETCDTEGLLAHYSCSRCGKNFEDRLGTYELGKVVVNKKYHTLVIVEGFAATCTSDGATTYKHCTTCGMTEVSVPIPALGHVDANGDHYCDRCSSAYMDGGEIVCTCNCHKIGFFNELIYKILKFFWQLLGKNKTCSCGAIHY